MSQTEQLSQPFELSEQIPTVGVETVVLDGERTHGRDSYISEHTPDLFVINDTRVVAEIRMPGEADTEDTYYVIDVSEQDTSKKSYALANGAYLASPEESDEAIFLPIYYDDMEPVILAAGNRPKTDNGHDSLQLEFSQWQFDSGVSVKRKGAADAGSVEIRYLRDDAVMSEHIQNYRELRDKGLLEDDEVTTGHEKALHGFCEAVKWLLEYDQPDLPPLIKDNVKLNVAVIEALDDEVGLSLANREEVEALVEAKMKEERGELASVLEASVRDERKKRVLGMLATAAGGAAIVLVNKKMGNVLPEVWGDGQKIGSNLAVASKLLETNLKLGLKLAVYRKKLHGIKELSEFQSKVDIYNTFPSRTDDEFIEEISNRHASYLQDLVGRVGQLTQTGRRRRFKRVFERN